MTECCALCSAIKEIQLLKKERDRYHKILEKIESAICRDCRGSGEIGLADGEVPCPSCGGSGDPTKPGVFYNKGKTSE